VVVEYPDNCNVGPLLLHDFLVSVDREPRAVSLWLRFFIVYDVGFGMAGQDSFIQFRAGLGCLKVRKNKALAQISSHSNHTSPNTLPYSLF
jgi:hypothetical protein